MNPIRVLHVLGGLNRGGAETMVMNLYRNIDRRKLQFDFIIHTTEECDYNKEIETLGGNIYNIPRYNGKNHFQYKKAWNKFFKDHPEYKIIHGHVRSTASIYLKIAKKYGITTIAHSHNTSSGIGLSAMAKNILQYPIRYTADYLFACSEVAGAWLFGKNACKKANFYILNNAIDTKKFIFNDTVRSKKRKKLGVSDKLVIGHIGRFDLQKNHDFLIDIFKEVYDKNDNSILMLIGDGELRDSIKEKVKNLGLSDNVIFTGVRPDIPDLLQAMDVFVFPSLFEGLGIVVIEAQATGLPCIVSDTIPKEAYVTEGIFSIPLVESTQKWANEILKYCNVYKRKNTLSQIITKGYDIEKTAEFLQDFYLQNSKGIE